ncbi:MAG: peptidoglycan editing factor PgeF [Candidatus Aminicenantes bacterium]|nr:peptidoglycan editing factor PgeF [Candidatus Aminicenantes bacterium]
MAAEKRYYQIESWLKIPWLVHGFGQAGFDWDNLVEEFSSFFPVEMKQQHSEQVIFLESRPENEIKGDGLVTGTRGLLLVVKTADCLPVFLVDRTNQLVAAVHCGWRGTKEKILLRALEIMRKKSRSSEAELWAGFGPAIEQRCYEVGREVFEQFRQNGFRVEEIFQPGEKTGHFYLDLRKANLLLLTDEAGLSERNIFQVDLCTRCRSELFSYRRDRDNAGRLLNFIGLK